MTHQKFSLTKRFTTPKMYYNLLSKVLPQSLHQSTQIIYQLQLPIVTVILIQIEYKYKVKTLTYAIKQKDLFFKLKTVAFKI